MLYKFENVSTKIFVCIHYPLIGYSETIMKYQLVSIKAESVIYRFKSLWQIKSSMILSVSLDSNVARDAAQNFFGVCFLSWRYPHGSRCALSVAMFLTIYHMLL